MLLGSRNGGYDSRMTASSENKRVNTVDIVDSITLDKESENPLASCIIFRFFCCGNCADVFEYLINLSSKQVF